SSSPDHFKSVVFTTENDWSYSITFQAASINTDPTPLYSLIDNVSIYSADHWPDESSNPGRPDDEFLRAKTTYQYDDLGRVYAQHVFSVDPTDGDVSTHSLDTKYWYDARGNVSKVSQPGGLVTKTAYDGAGRPVNV